MNDRVFNHQVNVDHIIKSKDLNRQVLSTRGYSASENAQIHATYYK